MVHVLTPASGQATPQLGEVTRCAWIRLDSGLRAPAANWRPRLALAAAHLMAYGDLPDFLGLEYGGVLTVGPPCRSTCPKPSAD